MHRHYTYVLLTHVVTRIRHRLYSLSPSLIEMQMFSLIFTGWHLDRLQFGEKQGLCRKMCFYHAVILIQIALA